MTLLGLETMLLALYSLNGGEDEFYKKQHEKVTSLLKEKTE